MSWGSSYDESNKEPLPWLDRLYRCMDHEKSTVTTDQKAEIFSLLLGVPPDEREERAASLFARVLFRNN